MITEVYLTNFRWAEFQMRFSGRSRPLRIGGFSIQWEPRGFSELPLLMTVVIFMIVAFDDNGHRHNHDFSWQVWSEHSWGVQSGTEVGGDGKSQTNPLRFLQNILLCWEIDHRTISYWWEIDQNSSAIEQSLIKNQSLIKTWSATDRNAQVVRKLDPRQFIRLASEAAPKINVNTNVSFKMMIIIMRSRFIIMCQDELSLGWWSKSWFEKITSFSRVCKYMLFQHKTICNSKETKLPI